MAFRISELTSAVNSYLNSISSANNKGATIGSDLKGIFQKYFNKAVSDVKVETPDISKEIRENIESHNFAVKEQFAQSGEISKAEMSGEKEEASKAVNKAYADNLASLIRGTSASGNLEIAQALETIMKSTGQNSENADAYRGLLSSDALRELSDSSYFTANMIQSSLFKPSDDEEGSSGSSGSSLSGQSINKLNENSLLSATLANGDTTYYQTLLQAYKNVPTESVFGDFLL